MMAPLMSCACKLNNMIAPLRKIADKIASPFLVLTIRLFMANIFFQSGWSKFENFLNDDWGSTLFLFQEIHPVPGIPAELAAVMGTGGEIILSVLLALGLFGRFGAAGLIVLTAVIQFAVPADYGMANPDHYMWMLLLAVPFVKGAGAISVDHFICRMLQKKACATEAA